MLDEFPDQILVCDFHVADPIRCDFSSERANLYGVEYIPHVFFDGVYNQLGAANCDAAAASYRTIINNRLAETNALSPVEIVGGFHIDGEMMNIGATFELVDPVSIEAARVHFAVLEDGVVSGETYDHVARWGTTEDVVLSGLGDIVQVTASVAVPATWNPNALTVVAWLQSMTTLLEVQQAALLLPIDPAAVDGEGILAGAGDWQAPRVTVGPNPLPSFADGTATVRLVLSASEAEAPMRVDLLDVGGRLIRQIHEGALSAGSHVLTWDGPGCHGTASGERRLLRAADHDGGTTLCATRGDRLVLTGRVPE